MGIRKQVWIRSLWNPVLSPASSINVFLHSKLRSAARSSLNMLWSNFLTSLPSIWRNLPTAPGRGCQDNALWASWSWTRRWSILRGRLKTCVSSLQRHVSLCKGIGGKYTNDTWRREWKLIQERSTMIVNKEWVGANVTIQRWNEELKGGLESQKKQKFTHRSQSWQIRGWWLDEFWRQESISMVFLLI